MPPEPHRGALGERSAAVLVDGKGPGCVCGNDCEMPCWQRVGLTSDPCCAGCVALPPVEGEPVNDPDAQAVIDAMRFVLMAQDDEAERTKLVNHLLELAPETQDNGGFDLVKDLLAEGVLKTQVNA